ncbi:MAG: DUF1211 domain-containing protein [Flavobacteriaceae bacterium]|nr:DUF1211 domain-containing protein [Flavobacteriaceae bacterium]
MNSGRVEAFSDGVLAIIITVMVLELEPPKEHTSDGLLEALPVFVSYVVSFIYISVYWFRHHQLFKKTKEISKKILWTNLLLLFWVSLIPFTTSWIGSDHVNIMPVTLYGSVLLFSEISFLILERSIVKYNKHVSGGTYKLKIDVFFLAIYATGLSLGFINIYFALVGFFLIGILKIGELYYFQSDKVYFSEETK